MSKMRLEKPRPGLVLWVRRESILMSLVKNLGIQMEIPLLDIVFVVTTPMTTDFKAPLVSFSKNVWCLMCVIDSHVRRVFV